MPDTDVRQLEDAPLPAYAARVLDAYQGVVRDADGWLALCPAHDDRRTPSLRITVGEAGRLLLKCRANCDTGLVLEAVGLDYADLFPREGDEPLAPLAREAQGWSLADADADLRHEVYSDFLGGLRLEPLHSRALRARGLADGLIDAAGYKTLGGTSARLLARLYDQFGDRLFAVPGFVPAARVAARLALDARGTLIPVRDRQSRVVALKLRRDTPQGGLRYVYLSGGDGESCCSPVHHPPPTPWEQNAGTANARVTEGELKADVAWALSGTYTVGVPGVACWGRAVAALELLGARRCFVAFDWPELKSNASVRNATINLARACRAVGVEPVLETWPDGYKGVDDALAAGLSTAAYYGRHADEQLDDDRTLYAFEAEPAPPPAVAVAPAVEAPTPSPTHAANDAGVGASGPPAFPLSFLPATLSEFVSAVAAAKQCPPDFAALACLAVAGAMCGSARQIAVTDSWAEQPLLYALVVAKAGARKTPGIKAVMRPVWEMQEEASAEAGEGPREHFYVDDATVESLVPILNKNPKGLVSFKDEAVSWVEAENQYKGGKGTDRQFWLQLWAGVPVKVDRKGGGSCFIPRPFVSVFGGIQPSKLYRLKDKNGDQDGFIDRILFAYPAAGLPEDWSEARVCPRLYEHWGLVLRRLRSLSAGDGQARLVEMTPAARAAYVAWWRQNLAEQKAMGDEAPLLGPWAKLEAYCARFALISCLLRHAEQADLWHLVPEQTEDRNVPAAGGQAERTETVTLPAHQALVRPDTAFVADEADVARAVGLVNYFKAHARRVYDVLHGSHDDGLADRVAGFLARRADRTASVRDMMRGLGLRKDVVERAMKCLANRDLGEGCLIPSASRSGSGPGARAFRLFVPQAEAVAPEVA